VLVESAKEIVKHMRGEIELPMKVVRVVPDVDVRAIREGQGLTREQFAERYGLQVRAIQEWEQGRRKPEPAVRAYMLVIKNQPAAVPVEYEPPGRLVSLSRICHAPSGLRATRRMVSTAQPVQGPPYG
jgi:putative transcriptional regulator